MRSILLIIVLILLSIHPARAANFSLVQSRVSTTPSTGLAFSGSVTAGNLLVVNVAWYQAAGMAPTLSSVADGGADTFTVSSCGADQSQIVNTNAAYVLVSASGTPTITPTFSSAPTAYVLFIYEYSYTGTATYDTCTSANIVGTNTSSTLTTSHTNELITTVLNSDSGYLGIPSGFATTPPDFLQFPIGAIYEADSTDLLDSGATGSKSIDWPLNSSGNAAQTNMAFYTTGGGGGNASHPLSLLGVGK